MALPLTAETYPLIRDADGRLVIEGTRVPLDTVVRGFLDGASPEEIALRFTSLDLADIYAVVTYYLRHREAVDDYLREREARSAEVRRENERRFPSRGIRERLLARRAT